MRNNRLPIISLRVLSARCLALSAIILLVIAASVFNGRASDSGNIHALFNLDSPAGGPFPSNRFTVADESQNTGLRVNLPKPDCAARPSDCEDLDVINTLDGFNLQPRLSIPFDGPIDAATVTSDTVFLIKLGETDNDDRGGRRVGINQVVWDQLTNTLHVESDEQLDQHSRYALVVTRGVRDQTGAPIEASEAFQRFRHDLNSGQADDPGLKRYRKELLEALAAARRAGVAESDIVSASVFTTQSATAILEKIRDQIKAATPAPADFNLGAGGTRTVFPLDNLTGITWNRQTGANPPRFTAGQPNLSLLRIIPGAVGGVAFGKYLSPDYMVHPGEYIPPVGTRTGAPQAQGTNEIYFNLFLPSSAKPAGGWPVVILGHGGLLSKNITPFQVAATMASRGIATIAINAVGHGSGPLGTLTVRQTVGEPVTFVDGGRGIDQNGDGVIGDNEGILAISPRTIIDRNDAIRQTVVDLMQLIRVIEVGIDVDSDGVGDLDPSRVSFFGNSLGGIYGTILLAVEPNIRVGVAGAAGGATVEWMRLGAGGNRSNVAGRRFLASRTPSLINSPGITKLGGVSLAPPYFNENLPLRNGESMTIELEGGTTGVVQSPVINTAPGAMAIQEVFEHYEWVSQSGNPVAFARHLRRSPLAGVPQKSVLFLFAKGDLTVQNPTTTALLRAGDLADRTTYFLNDLALAEDPTMAKDPHGFAFRIFDPGALARQIALGAQQQVALFLASNGELIIHPEPRRFFEVPIILPLPEGLSYIP